MKFTLGAIVRYNLVFLILKSFAKCENQIPECCPLGWTLVRLHSNQNETYDCLGPEEVVALEDEVEIYGETKKLVGYNIQTAKNVSNIPYCKQPELRILVTNNFEILSSQTCLANMDKKIVAISCPGQENETQIYNFVHKCCPSGYVYNSSQQECVIPTHAQDYKTYGEFFPNSTAGVILIDSAVNCPKNKVLIEYRMSSADFYFKNGKINLNGLRTQHLFGIKDYCIEEIQNNVKIVEKHVERVKQSPEFIVRTCTGQNICLQIPCIRRCCSDGEMFTKGNATSYCKKDDSDIWFHSFESLQISGNFTKPSVFGILRSLDCLKYRLDPDSFADEMHSINERDGSLHVVSTQKNYTNSQYCVEKIGNSAHADQKLYTFLCFDYKVVSSDNIRFKLYPIGLLISCIFYAMTLGVYLSISRLRNLPGKILICLVCSLFAAYLSIALGQLKPTSNDDICFASGFFVYFCLIAAFAWMNVMCFDIWQTFGSTRRKQVQKRQTKRFVIYSIYGWGLPITLTIVTISLTKSGVLSENICPHFGHGRCWFTYDNFASASLIFFSGPVGILFLINLVLFSLTLRYCNRVKREIFRMQSSSAEKPVLKRRFFMDKARFAMNTKLFIVMGITWLLELLSILLYDHKKTFFWVISDSFNVLLGVFVFFIFVFKKRVLHSVQERIGLRTQSSTRTMQNTTMASPSIYTQTTSMTRLNMPDGGVSPVPGGVKHRSPLL